MNSPRTTILTITAVAALLASCAPYPPGSMPYYIPGLPGSAGPYQQPPANQGYQQPPANQGYQQPPANQGYQQPHTNVPAPQAPVQNAIPLGRRPADGKPNMVISPYHPYNLIDVSGYKSGDVVGDISTATKNRTTGKIDPRTSKHFRIP